MRNGVLIENLFVTASSAGDLVPAFGAIVGGNIVSERLIEVEADTVEQAERKLRNIDELIVVEQFVVCHERVEVIEAVADTVEGAFLKAQGKVPAGAQTETREIKAAAKQITLLVQANDEESAGKGKAELISSVSLLKKARKGIFGFGKTANVYEVVISQKAVVELTYRVRAKLRAKVRNYSAEELLESIQEIRRINTHWTETLQLLNPKNDSEIEASLLKLQELYPLSALDIIEDACRRNEKANWRTVIKKAEAQASIARSLELEEKKVGLRKLDVEIAETFMFYTSIDWYEKDYRRKRKEPTGLPKEGYGGHHVTSPTLRETIPHYSSNDEAFSKLEERIKGFNLYELYLQLLFEEGQDEAIATLEQKCIAALKAQKLSYNQRTIKIETKVISPSSQNKVSALRQKLLSICLGNEDQVDRLINSERQCNSTAKEEQLYKDVIERWIRDNE